MQIVRYILGGRSGEARFSIGPSCYLLMVRVLGRIWRFIVDCGVEPAPWGPAFSHPDIERLEEILAGEKIDAVFLTHAHLDHCGYLPALDPFLKPDAKIFCTPTTAVFLPHVLGEVFDRMARQTDAAGILPFDLWALFRTTGAHRLHVVRTPSVLTFGDKQEVQVLVWPAGHINGACSFIFRITERGVTKKIAFQGDYASHNQTSVSGARLPPAEWLLDGSEDAIASLDCTNGAEDMTLWQVEFDRLVRDWREVAARKGVWVGVTFAMVRCQILLDVLGKEMAPDSQDAIYVSGFSPRLYTQALEYRDMNEARQWGELPLDFSRAMMLGARNPPAARGLCVVTPSGMGHGPAVKHFQRWAHDPEALFAFTGFVAPGTNADIFLRAAEGSEVELRGENDESRIRLIVWAQRRHYRLTSHQYRYDAVARALELFGVNPAAIQTWCETGVERGVHVATYLSSRDARHLGTKHLGLTHGSARALDWFESYFSDLIPLSRSDEERDRKNLEL